MADEDNMSTAGKFLDAKLHEECIGMDPYECEDAIRRLNDYLDHQLSEAERVIVIKHLEICRPCLRRFTFEQTLIVSLRQKVTAVCAPQSLREKLHALLRQAH